MRIRCAMSEDAIQRYYEIREKYWRVSESSWTDLNELKKRTRALAAHRAEFSSYITELLKLGHEGHVEASFALGDAYVAGNGVSRDRARAILWFKKAAEAGHVRAMVRLANALTHPDSPATAEEGVLWLKKAAAVGDSAAMVFLGFAYREGKGVPPDYEEAARWFTRAYEAGDLLSMAHIGRLHAWWTKSPALALPWLRRAADAGFTDSYWALATLCADVKSPFFSPAEAVHWYRAIANSPVSGAARALVYLARLTRDGIGTEQNFSLAQTYLETALTLAAPKEVRLEAEKLLTDIKASLL